MGRVGTFLKKVLGKSDEAATARKSGFVDTFGQHSMGKSGSIFDPLRQSHKTQKTSAKVARNRADTLNRGVTIVNAAEDIKLMGLIKWSGFAVIGFTAWRAISLIGVISESAEDTINNFFGINCAENDIACQEQGAKNMLNTGLLVAAGIGGLIVLSLKKDSQKPVASS